jgi:hypothetical protein
MKRKRRRKANKRIKQEKEQRQEWAWKKCIHDRYSSPSTKAPTGNTYAPLALTAPHVWTSPSHITSLTWLG